MQPKFLLGPSLVIFGLIATLTIGLLFMRPERPNANETKFEAQLRAGEIPDIASREEFASRHLQKWFYGTALKGIIICVIVCAIPIKRGTAIIMRPALFAFGSFVDHTIQNAQNDPLGTMIKFGVMGAIVAVFVGVMRRYQSAFPDRNTPAHYRWSKALRESQVIEDDPDSLERLENLRAAAAAPHRVLT